MIQEGPQAEQEELSFRELALTPPLDFTLTAERIEKFQNCLAGSSIFAVDYDDIPEPALDTFESLSNRFFPPVEYFQRNFSALFTATIDGDEVYLAQQQRDYSSRSTKHIMEATYLVEMRDGEEIGKGELRFRPFARHEIPNSKPEELDYFEDKPFERYTQTIRFKNSGLAIRRTQVWGAYSEAFYNLPLHSDTLFVTHEFDENGKAKEGINSYAERSWVHLVSEGLGESYSQQASEKIFHRRYKLKPRT